MFFVFFLKNAGKFVTLFSSLWVNQLLQDWAQIEGEEIFYGMIEFHEDMFSEIREIEHRKSKKNALLLFV